MRNHETGCAEHCIRLALRYFGRKDFQLTGNDTLAIYDLIKAVRHAGLVVYVCLPFLSKLRFNTSVRPSIVKRSFALRIIKEKRQDLAIFVSGTAFDLYRVHDSWCHTIVFVMKDGHPVLYDPYFELAGKKAQSYVSCTDIDGYVNNRWTVIVLAADSFSELGERGPI